jgi:hypothetical protein
MDRPAGFFVRYTSADLAWGRVDLLAAGGRRLRSEGQGPGFLAATSGSRASANGWASAGGGGAAGGAGRGVGRRVTWRPNSRITGIVQTSGTTSQIGRSAHQVPLGWVGGRNPVSHSRPNAIA